MCKTYLGTCSFSTLFLDLLLTPVHNLSIIFSFIFHLIVIFSLHVSMCLLISSIYLFICNVKLITFDLANHKTSLLNVHTRHDIPRPFFARRGANIVSYSDVVILHYWDSPVEDGSEGFRLLIHVAPFSSVPVSNTMKMGHGD